MFNYSAEQLFILQPRECGGGILSFILSLDSSTAALNFKKLSTEQKLKQWQDHVQKSPIDSHVFGFSNFSSRTHERYLNEADNCARYIHKQHFYELDQLNSHKQHQFLTEIIGEKKSIGIYVTDDCILKLKKLRPRAPLIDYYAKWIYSNQKKLLQDFYNITSLHHFSFGEMLNQDTFIDHLKYCKDLLNLDIDIDVAQTVVSQWHEIMNIELL